MYTSVVQGIVYCYTKYTKVLKTKNKKNINITIYSEKAQERRPNGPIKQLLCTHQGWFTNGADIVHFAKWIDHKMKLFLLDNQTCANKNSIFRLSGLHCSLHWNVLSVLEIRRRDINPSIMLQCWARQLVPLYPYILYQYGINGNVSVTRMGPF